MSFIEFDLQRFNDGATLEDTTPNQEQVSGGQEEDNTSYDFALDENGNIVFLNQDEESEDNVEEGNPEQDQPETNYYTSEEISQLGIDKLDPNRLPPELQPFYKSMQADYVRKTQALAEQRKAIEMAVQQFQQPNPQPTPESPQNLQRQYYEQLYALAKGNVEQAFGEAFDELNPLHVAALSDEVANIKVQIIQAQSYQNSLQQLMTHYGSIPDWNEIDRFAAERLDNMPYKQAAVIKEKIKAGDIATIKAFLDESIEEWNARKNPQAFVNANPTTKKPNPPHVEPGGSGNADTPKQVNFKELGRMTHDEQAAWLDRMMGLTK